MYERFSPSARLAMQFSNQSCQRFGHYYEPGAILPLHVLDGILKIPWGGAADIFAHLVGDKSIVHNKVVEALLKIPGKPGAFMGKIGQSPATKEVIQSAIQEAENRKCSYVGTEHLLIGIVRLNEADPAPSLLKQWCNCNTILNHLGVINYDSSKCKTTGEKYREWFQTRSIDDNCQKTALILSPAWRSQFGCRIDDAIDLLDCAKYAQDCPDVLTANWLIQFAKEDGNQFNTSDNREKN